MSNTTPDGRGAPRQRKDSQNVHNHIRSFPAEALHHSARLTSQAQASGQRAEHCIAMCSNASLGQHQLGECEGKLVSTRVREAATERGTGRGGHKAEIALASSR